MTEDTNPVQLLREPFLVNGLRVEPSALRLSGPQGESTLEPKVMALLVALSDRPGELWLRSELVAVLWPNRFGSDESLTRLVSVLRRTLATDHGIRDVLTTVPKLGYRLDAEVRDIQARGAEQRPQSTAAPGRKGRVGWIHAFSAALVMIAVSAWLLLLPGTDDAGTRAAQAGAADPVPGLPERSAASLAVLTIESLTPNESRAFLADGMTRDLTAQLSRVPNLHVVPYYSAREFSDAMADVTAARDVHYMVSGSLLEQQNRVMLRIDLTDAEHGQQVWSKRYSKPLEDFFALQDQVIEEIAMTIFSELQAAEIEQIRAKDAFDLSVYELIQSAEGEREVYSQAAADRILRTLDRALEMDPDNPAVLSRLAIQLTQGLASGFSEDPVRDIGLASRYIERARAISPRDPRVLMGAGIASFMTGETHKAERLLEMSRAADPNEPHAAAILGLTKCYLGRTEAGLALIRTSEARAPRNPRHAVWAHYRGICHYLQDDWIAASAAYRDAMDRNPNYTSPYLGHAVVECALGREAEGRRAYRRALRLDPGFRVAEWLVAVDLTRLPDTPRMTVVELERIARTCLEAEPGAAL